MQRDPGSNKVDEIFRNALDDDEPLEEGDIGVGQTRRLGADAGAAQSVYAGAPQASGVAPEREGLAPLPPDRGSTGEAGAPPEAALESPTTLDEGRTDVERNAAGGGWAGTSEVVESDDETEQLRIREARGELGEADPDEGQPHERMRK
jgi:hypothetical protein